MKDFRIDSSGSYATLTNDDGTKNFYALRTRWDLKTAELCSARTSEERFSQLIDEVASADEDCARKKKRWWFFNS